LGIAIVCDDFFVPSLEAISEELNLSEDVAGATFMAAGSSAPELFTSMMSLVAPSGENELGIGAIVGSAVFNILMIVGATAVFTGKTLDIDWRPLLRDASFYAFSIATTLIFFQDKKIYWYEGLISVLAYCLYVTFMCFNEKIMDTLGAWEQKNFPKAYAKRQAAMEKTEDDGSEEKRPVTEATTGKPSPSSTRGASVELQRIQTPASESGSVSTIDANSVAGSQAVCESVSDKYAAPEKDGKAEKVVDPEKGEAQEATEGEDEDDGSPFDLPENPQDYPLWALSLPWYFVFTYTVPPCGDEGWKKWYISSFCSSILWIAAISYMMVESTAKIGCILDIPSIVMGNTILAAGTSIPDALSSITVAKQGMGDMAVANAVGSNVFDIWLGLGLPWLFYLPFVGGSIDLDVGQLLPNILILLAVLFLYFGAIAASGFKLSVFVGQVFMGLYVVYTAYLLIFVWVLDIYNEKNDSNSAK
jgi:sodium/potassium/calcium exchanger 4